MTEEEFKTVKTHNWHSEHGAASTDYYFYTNLNKEDRNGYES